MKNDRFVKFIIIFFVIFAIVFPIILKTMYKNLSYPEWYGILASFIGGAIGGITTLIALYISTNQTRRIQADNKEYFEESQNKEKIEKMKTAAFVLFYDLKLYLECIQQYVIDYCMYKINYMHRVEPSADKIINTEMDIGKLHIMSDKWMEQVAYISEGVNDHLADIEKLINTCSMCKKSTASIKDNKEIGKALELISKDIFCDEFMNMWINVANKTSDYISYCKIRDNEQLMIIDGIINNFKKYTRNHNEKLYIKNDIDDVLSFLKKINNQKN